MPNYTRDQVEAWHKTVNQRIADLIKVCVEDDQMPAHLVLVTLAHSGLRGFKVLAGKDTAIGVAEEILKELKKAQTGV